MVRYVLGIDPSLAASGVSLLRHSSPSQVEYLGGFVYGESIGRDVPKNERQAKCISLARGLAANVDEFLSEYDVQSVDIVLEDFSYGQTAHVAYDLGVFGGVLRDRILLDNGSYIMVSPTTFKSFLAGRRVTSREGKALAVELAAPFGVEARAKFQREALSDAFGMAYLYLCIQDPTIDPARAPRAKAQRVVLDG